MPVAKKSLSKSKNYKPGTTKVPGGKVVVPKKPTSITTPATTKVDPELFHKIKQAIKIGMSKELVLKKFAISERTYYRVKAVRYHIQYRRAMAGQNKPMPGTSVATIEQHYKPRPAVPAAPVKPEPKKSLWQKLFGR